MAVLPAAVIIVEVYERVSRLCEEGSNVSGPLGLEIGLEIELGWI